MADDIVARMRAQAAKAREGWRPAWERPPAPGMVYLLDNPAQANRPMLYEGLSPSGCLQFQDLTTGQPSYTRRSSDLQVRRFKGEDKV
jgi:hypothetical protein